METKNSKRSKKKQILDAEIHNHYGRNTNATNKYIAGSDMGKCFHYTDNRDRDSYEFSPRYNNWEL